MNTLHSYTVDDLKNALETCNLQAADVDVVLGAWGRATQANDDGYHDRDSGWEGAFALRLRDDRFCAIYASRSACSDHTAGRLDYHSCEAEALDAIGNDPFIAPPDLQRWVRSVAPRPEDVVKTIEMRLPVSVVLSLVEDRDKARAAASDLRTQAYHARKDMNAAIARENEAKAACAMWKAKADALVEVLRKHGVSPDACFLPIRAVDDLLTDLETKLATALARAEARFPAATSPDLTKFVAEVSAQSDGAGPEQAKAFDAYREHFKAESDKLRAGER